MAKVSFLNQNLLLHFLIFFKKKVQFRDKLEKEKQEIEIKHQKIMKDKIKENEEKITKEQKEILKSQLDKLDKVCNNVKLIMK